MAQDVVILLQYIYYIRRSNNVHEVQPLLPQHHNVAASSKGGINYAFALPLCAGGLMMYAATMTSSYGSVRMRTLCHGACLFADGAAFVVSHVGEGL
jgi:hypothetical protein